MMFALFSPYFPTQEFLPQNYTSEVLELRVSKVQNPYHLKGFPASTCKIWECKLIVHGYSCLLKSNWFGHGAFERHFEFCTLFTHILFISGSILSMMKWKTRHLNWNWAGWESLLKADMNWYQRILQRRPTNLARWVYFATLNVQLFKQYRCIQNMCNASLHISIILQKWQNHQKLRHFQMQR